MDLSVGIQPVRVTLHWKPIEKISGTGEAIVESYKLEKTTIDELIVTRSFIALAVLICESGDYHCFPLHPDSTNEPGNLAAHYEVCW